MDRFINGGGRRLTGEIEIGGANNSSLKLMVAGLLTSERLVLSNVPGIADITTMRDLITGLGPSVEDVGPRTLSIGGEIASVEAPYDIVSKMRASILVLGPLLARAREATLGAQPLECRKRVAIQLGGAHPVGHRRGAPDS